MAVLIADRFLCRADLTSASRGFPCAVLSTIDLATGAEVRLKIGTTGSRQNRRAWLEVCARAYGEGALVDFGFIGTTRRFEAIGGRSPHRSPVPDESPNLRDWLEHPHPASPRILQVRDLPDGRDLRLNGWIPCHTSVLFHKGLAGDLRMTLGGRSVAVLDAAEQSPHLVLALLRLQAAGVSHVCVLSQRERAVAARVERAAEGRAMYTARVIGADPRTDQIVGDSERMRERGRHAAAERGFRSAAAAFERRRDAHRAGDAWLRLGHLLLGRGRAAHAKAAFTDARERFLQCEAAERATEASVFVGLAETDLALFTDAERTLRSAYTSASALAGRPLAFAAVSLARTLAWQERHREARLVLDAALATETGDLSPRCWCLAARLHVASGSLAEAWSATRQARAAAKDSTAADALVRRWEAAIQARVGDVDAVRAHIARGLQAARHACLPLQALSLRLTLIEALVYAGQKGEARGAARHFRKVRPGTLPALLKSRLDQLLQAIDREGTGKPRSLVFVRESAPVFPAAPSISTVEDLEELRGLLMSAHQLESETDALNRAAAVIRRHTHAAGVSVFACTRTGARLVANAGSGSESLARRAISVAQSIAPERGGGGVDGAVPVQYLGRCVGAMAMRWSVEGPANAAHAMAFASAAVAVCAPLVYALVERESPPPRDDTSFDLIGVSSAMADVRGAIARAANAPFTVLIEGESGSGKELVARAIHRAGCRRDRRFCAFNCAAMPEDLVDTELFGHARGAFTGAAGERVGLFEGADGGTVFLDEVGELSARAQAKVLRVLQEGEVRRLGENFTRKFDARLVAATNRSLRADVDAGRFRQDLLYRLDVIRLRVPPLRDRREDIPLLAGRFWRDAADRIGSKAVLGPAALAMLARYDWPGNVRELQNVLAALAVSTRPRGVVAASDLPDAIARAAQPGPSESLESARLKFEQRFVRAALARAAGHRGRTAAALGLSRQGLAKLMQRLHLDV
jgi:DNA-binding NtrC family response regulator